MNDDNGRLGGETDLLGDLGDVGDVGGVGSLGVLVEARGNAELRRYPARTGHWLSSRCACMAIAGLVDDEDALAWFDVWLDAHRDHDQPFRAERNRRHVSLPAS